MAKLLGPAWHIRQGYETCGCGRPQCRSRRKDERRRERRIQKQEFRKEVQAA